MVDVSFPDELPEIYHALTVNHKGENLTLEVQQHLTGNVVRSIALGPTDGLKRGLKVTNTGAPIQVTVGKQTLGRLFDVLGLSLIHISEPTRPY